MLPVVVEQAVVGDAIEPGRELRQRFIAGTGVDDLEPDVLIKFLGQPRIAALVRQVAVEPGALTAVECFEGCHIAIAIGEHQAFVTEVVVHGRQFSSPLCRVRQRGQCPFRAFLQCRPQRAARFAESCRPENLFGGAPGKSADRALGARAGRTA
jgi:hypothetical protein